MQGTIVAIENSQKLLYGLQYHPEVQHSERGIATLKRFLFGIAKMPADWRIENVLKEEMDKISATVSVLTTFTDCLDVHRLTGMPPLLTDATSPGQAQARNCPSSATTLLG